MKKKRKQYTPQGKVTILKQHLMDNIAVSDLCDEHELHPNVFYRWQSQFFEGGTSRL
jgi:transposase